MRQAFAEAFLLTISAAAGLAQTYSPGPQVLSYTSDVDGTEQPYALYLPKLFDSSKRYPLVISLHAEYSNHRLNLRRLFGQGNRIRESDAEASRYFPSFRDVNFIVACPFARGTIGYQGLGETDVSDVMADVKRRFPVDDDRVYLTGNSMGGGGALWLGLTRPDLWAAVAPVSPAAPSGVEELAPNAAQLAWRFFHGDQDPLVPVDMSRVWLKRLLALGAAAEYVEYPGVRHNAGDFAYKNGAVFDWFDAHHRDRNPDRVRFVSARYKYSHAYWVTFDGFTPGTVASIDARFTGRNQIEITTHDLDGFTLQLDGHPQFFRTAPMTVTIDRGILKLKPNTPHSFSKTSRGWSASKYAPASNEKRPGLEGPILEAVSARHVYIFGAGLAEPPAASRKDALTPLAIKSDRNVTEEDLARGSLVLFGTKETNRVIARFSRQFPIELNAGAADYGLLFIAPIGNRYALVNSGLPWWTGVDRVRRPGWSFIPENLRALQSFGDFILFKGSLENIVAEGRFDRYWKVPAADAAKMKATGAVVLQ